MKPRHLHLIAGSLLVVLICWSCINRPETDGERFAPTHTYPGWRIIKDGKVIGHVLPGGQRVEFGGRNARFGEGFLELLNPDGTVAEKHVFP